MRITPKENKMEEKEEKKEGDQPRKNIKIRIIVNKTNWSIYDLATKDCPPGWEAIFKDADNELKRTSEVIERDEKQHSRCFPLRGDIFRAFHLTPLDKVRVVIFGQDPYHSIEHDGNPTACGLSFSARPGMKIPPSLANIFEEIHIEYPNLKKFSSGDLTPWAKQGVLLLNSCLTVRNGEAGSHKKLWLGFISKVLKGLGNLNKKIIYVLWGTHAQSLSNMITGKDYTTLESVHPSGFSAHKGFFNNGHFKKINEILRERGEDEINWEV